MPSISLSSRKIQTKCHHCGVKNPSFPCHHSECNNIYCKKCLTGIYRYSNKNLRKYCKLSTWTCPACRYKCLCGKCPHPLKGTFRRDDTTNSKVRTKQLRRQKQIVRKKKEKIEIDQFVYKSENIKIEKEDEKLISNKPQISPIMTQEVVEKTLKNDPQYGEIINPTTFSFETQKKQVIPSSPYIMPYSFPMTDYVNIYQRNPVAITMYSYMQYSGHSSIIPYPSPSNLYTYYGRCNQM